MPDTESGLPNGTKAGACANVSRHMGTWECISVIVGIVVGVSIFKVPALVFSNVPTLWHGLAAWLAGGVLSVVGALCYAELATSYPRQGGDYTWLTRAFHPFVGYLFGWGRLSVIQTGSIGALAYVFADYAVALFNLSRLNPAWFAILVVIVLTFVNILGIRCGKTTQNVLTLLKVAGIAAIVVAGIAVGGSASLASVQGVRGPGLGLAMILILYAYGGWNEAAFVAAEMRDPSRSIPRALILSTAAITLIYLIINGAYLLALGFEGLRASPVPAAAVLERVLGRGGMKGISIVVLLSVLGALNGTIMTGSRVYAAVGEEHGVFALLGRWSSRLGTPVWALVIQGGVTLVMILSVGTVTGRGLLDALLQRIGVEALPWSRYGGGFDTLVSATAPVFWLFFFLVGVSLLILRFRDRGFNRPFSVPLYPVLPLVFCGMCLYMLHASFTYAGSLSVLAVVVLVLGAPLYAVGRRLRSAPPHAV